MGAFDDFVNLPFDTHLMIGTIIRLCLVWYSQLHDEMCAVPYTDVDYKVVTDAAWHVINGESPYKRHTYRYSPLLALAMTPNILLNRNFGKTLFSTIDIVVGIAIRKLIKENNYSVRAINDRNRIASHSALLWIYNPLAIVIATRGNADTIASFFIIISLLFYQTNIVNGDKKFFISGLFLGIAIHFRIYPIVFGLPMYIALRQYKINRSTRILFDLYQMIPNLKQCKLVIGCISSLSALTGIFLYFYGYEFLFETYIYHILRKDTRHNFSLFFYLQYLNTDKNSQWYKAVPFLLLILHFGLRYGRKNTINFAVFTQAVVLVIYNSVITSQYFIWFLSLLPLCINDIKISKKKAMFLFLLWLTSQGAWLFYAYQLEFLGKNMFFHVWCCSVAFYIANLYILQEFIKNYKPGHVHEIKHVHEVKMD